MKETITTVVCDLCKRSINPDFRWYVLSLTGKDSISLDICTTCGEDKRPRFSSRALLLMVSLL